MKYLHEITGIRPSSRKFVPSDRLLQPTLVTGVEVEVEFPSNIRKLPDIDDQFWNQKGDGSLRGHGVEYVTKPLFGEDLVFALSSLEEAINNNKTTPTISERCGLHIHLDVSGFSTEQLLCLCCVVALTEPVIYNYVGKDRMDNIYCLPMYASNNILPYLNSIKYGETTNEIKKAILSTVKYSGFNILPIMSQGSVEFRYHKGTYSAEDIIKWINFLMGLHLAAQNYNPRELVAMGMHDSQQLIFSSMGNSYYEYRGVEEERMTESWLVAKDILNFNKLDDTWKNIKSIYLSSIS